MRPHLPKKVMKKIAMMHYKYTKENQIVGMGEIKERSKKAKVELMMMESIMYTFLLGKAILNVAG